MDASIGKDTSSIFELEAFVASKDAFQ